MNRTIIEALNLEVNGLPKPIVEKEFCHKCHIGENYNHMIHGQHAQLNTLVDLIITLAEKVDQNQKILYDKWEKILQKMSDNNKTLKDLLENQRYIKDQNEVMLRKTRQIDENSILEKQQKILKQIIEQKDELKGNYEKTMSAIYNLEKIIIS